MLLQWLDVFKAGQSCTLHRSLLLRAFIPRCVTLWVSSARTHEETRLRAFSLKDTSAARFSFFFLYCHFSDIHTLQVRFNVAPLCAKHSPTIWIPFSFFLSFFLELHLSVARGSEKSSPLFEWARSQLFAIQTPPPSFSWWIFRMGRLLGATCLFFFSKPHLYKTSSCSCSSWRGIIWCSDTQKLHIHIHIWRKIAFNGLFLYFHNRFHPFW